MTNGGLGLQTAILLQNLMRTDDAAQSFLRGQAGGDDGDRRAADFFNPFQICFGIIGQFLIIFDAESRFFPTLHCFVNRFAGFHRIRTARQDIGFAAVGQFVADADIDGFNAVHYIEFGNAHTGNAVDLDGAFQGGGIKPAAAACAAGYRAEFVSAFRQTCAYFVEQFGRERA